MPHQKAKVVRFAYKNVFHSPPTPALSMGPSEDSSAGPITPPPAKHGLPGPTPYASSYFPTSKHSSHHHYHHPAPTPLVIRPHRYLEPTGLLWDLTEHPSHALRHRETISRRVLSEPASSPPLHSLSIRSRHLPWSVHVQPSHHAFVTLGDVLDAIYRSLRTNITSDEFNSLPTTNDQRRATRAYEQRYRKLMSPKDYDAEKRGGVKRVDFLMGYTRFGGISHAGGRHPEEWILHTS